MVVKKIYLIIFAVFLFAFLLNSGNKAVDSVVYDICASMSDEEISHDDFEILLEAMHNNQCNEAWNVKTTFSMSKKDFDKIANTYAIIDSDGNPLVFYRTGSPSAIGAGAILVYGNSGDFPVKLGDRLHIWTSGDPKDIIIELSDQGCDPYDNDCDAACSFEENGVCDPLCYVDNAGENVPCDMDCVDKNGNNIIDAGDLDGICDKDCYNKDLDPLHAYDPDCIGTEPFCDPDTQGARDGICDSNCAPKNKICDFDCNGTVHAGNPSGLKDKDCYECDGTCNNFCSYFCTGIDHDPDCPGGFKDWFQLTECCGDGTCGLTENCKLCALDCMPGALGKVEGEPCTCTPECNPGLVCNGPGSNFHCCPSGQEWNGTDCAVGIYFNLIFVALNWAPTEDFEFRASARIALDDFMAKSPFKECPDPERRVRVHYIDPANCQQTCTDHCTDCIEKASDCVAANGLGALALNGKFAAITKGTSLAGNLGCAGGIPSGGESTSSGRPEVTTHELGHALGLYHIDVCGAPNQATDCPCACTPPPLGCQPGGTACSVPTRPNYADCSEPDRYKFVMDYCNPMDHFGPAAYSHLKNAYIAGPPSSGLSKWLNGC